MTLRKLYNEGIYWRQVYEDYKELYPNEWSFWAIYNGKKFSLVMPEVFTEENKKKHHGMTKAGSKNGRAKLTEKDVIDIRIKHQKGYTNK